MAKNLNKSRMRNSKIIVIVALVAVFFTGTLIPYEKPLHEGLEFFGYLLISLCAMGRLYSTAFLGGFKNKNLITYGAYSIVRNPLYTFSLIGMTGIAFLSGRLVLIIVMPVFFFILYHFLIKREEMFLLQSFGEEYKAYMARTPCLIPNFRLYQAPETIETVPRYLNKAFKDAIWWFAVFPLFEFSEFLQNTGWIKPLFVTP